MRRGMLVWALAAAVTARAEAQAPPETAARQKLTDAEQQRFLLEGEIVKTKGAPSGVTLSTRATLRLDEFVHDAHIQTIDEAKPVMSLVGGSQIDFRDSYKGNVAAYRIDRLLGLGMVPVTVVRRYGNKQAAFTWWVDDVAMTEGGRLEKKLSSPDPATWNRQMYIVRVFDELIFNFDRNLGNLVIDKDWRIWMIDHTRAFKVFKQMKAPEQLGTRCERGFFAALKGLEEPALREATKDVLIPAQITGLLARRDLIVRHFEKKIGELGEAEVLYDHPARLSEAPPPQ
jgi:hypothetical protein